MNETQDVSSTAETVGASGFAPTRRVLVYGTLRGALAEVGANLLQEGVVEGLTLFDLGAFPAAVVSPGDCIVGEVWELDPATADGLVSLLDAIEGHPHFYQRQKRTTRDGIDVELYILPHEQAYGEPCGERWNGPPRDWGLGDRLSYYLTDT